MSEQLLAVSDWFDQLLWQRTSEDFAYLAGLLDGEGHFGIVRHDLKLNHGRYHPIVQVGMTNGPLVRWVNTHFGGVLARIRLNDLKRKPMFQNQWGYRQAYRLCKKLLPYLKLKLKHAQLILTWYEEGGTPAGANWRWHPETIRAKQFQLWKRMRELNATKGGAP